MSVHDMTSCDSVSAVIDRRSRSVDSGLVTDVADLAQRAVMQCDAAAAAVPTCSSALLSAGQVVGSCDSGLPQAVEHDDDLQCTQSSVPQPTDRLSCATVASHCASLRTKRHADDGCVMSSPVTVAVTHNGQSWLLRLFESKLFDMSIAIQYLFNSKESGVQAYIGEFSGYILLGECVPCRKLCLL